MLVQVWFADADGQGQGSWWKAQILIDNRPEQVGLTTAARFAVLAAALCDRMVHTTPSSLPSSDVITMHCAGGGGAGGPLVLRRAVGAVRGAVGPGARGEYILNSSPHSLIRHPHAATQTSCLMHAQAFASTLRLSSASLQAQAGAAASEEQLDKQSPWELFDEGVTVSNGCCKASLLRGGARHSAAQP